MRSVEWRQLDQRLWVGRSDGRHLGTIEQGRRFLVTDACGDVRGRCLTLELAKALLLALQDADDLSDPLPAA